MCFRLFSVVLLFLSLSSYAGTIDTSAVIKAKAPATIFTIKEQLEFKSLLNDISLRWTLKNWKGEILRSGVWPNGGKDVLILEPLPTGYYTLELQSDVKKISGARSFMVVIAPASRKRNPNTYFAMDSAQSWLASENPANTRHPSSGFEVVSEALRRSGVEVVRERMSWTDTGYAPGKFNWGKYEKNANLLSERGIAISGMYHDAPKYTKNNVTRQLPSDLLATYRYAKEAARHFRGKMLSWEFWNEEDLYFAKEGAWDFAAAMKAASLGFKAGAPTCPVLLGGLAVTPLSNFNQIVMDNGVGDYIDIFNIHSYHPLRNFPAIISNTKDFLKKNNLANRPIWITEMGSNVEGQGRINSYMKGLKAHDSEQEFLVAEFLSKALITMQTLGVDRNFFFVFAPYNEVGGGKDWGLLRRDYSAKPGVAAFSTLSELLNTAKYCGTFDFGNPNVCGFLYELPDGTQTLAFWSKSHIDTWDNNPNAHIEDLYEKNVQISLSNGSYNGRDIVGMPFAVQAVNGIATLKVNRFPAYLTGLKGLKVARPFVAEKKGGTSQDIVFDPTIILRVNPSSAFSHDSGKDRMYLMDNSGKMEIEVYNLSDCTKQGKISLVGGNFEGLPDVITLPPFGKKSFEVEFSPMLGPGKFYTIIRASGIFNGKSISPLVIPLCMLNKMIEEARKVPLPGTKNPINWKKNSSGKMEIFFDEAEESIVFKTQFPPKVDRWVYPEYSLKLPQESLAGAIGISFEIKCSTDNIQRGLLMGVVKNNDGKTRDFYFPYKNPENVWQERVSLFFNNKLDGSKLDPAQIIRIRIGINSKIDNLTYSIRNIRVLYAK